MCSSTYNGQLLWDTVLDGWQAGILMVAGGRKDGWEERPRPPNPGWRLYGGSLSVRILIYAGTCRASQPLLHRAWNVWWQCRGCIAIYSVVCRASQPLLHGAWNVWWQCSNICAIYASGCRVAQHLLHRAWNDLVAMQLQHSNICEWLQGLHSPCSIMHGRIWIVAWAIWQQITRCCADEIPCRKRSCKEFPCSKNPSLFNIKEGPLPARFPFPHLLRGACPDLPVSRVC